MKYLAIIVAALIITWLVLNRSLPSPFTRFAAANATQFWPYQCLDTMKTSRDKARAWKDDPKLDTYIKTEIGAIKQVGANCVAIGTPYNDEFLPYLTKWVTEARAQGLHIWFRGNFAEWEGWFNYRKGMTNDQLLTKTTTFVTSHPDLFQDGDIFTAAPEAENGGTYNQVEKDEYASYRQFLLDEQRVSADAFSKIGKKVEVNWASMNGGFARRLLDQPTIDGLGKVATLDHYIKTAPEMGDYIDYFDHTFGAKVIVGEFGAPIPEINGAMTQDQQAKFVEELMQQLYHHRSQVSGLNYWTSTDSSSAVFNLDGSFKPAAHVLQNTSNRTSSKVPWSIVSKNQSKA